MVKLISFVFGFGVVDGARRSEVASLDITTGACLIPNTKREPDMAGQGRTIEKHWQGCQSRCADTKGCVYFSHWVDGGCHIQDESAVQSFSWSGSSGPVLCSSATTTTTTTTTAPRRWAHTTTTPPAQKVDSLTKWFKSMDGGHMMRGANDRAVREATDNPDLNVAKLKSLSAFFESMKGGHLIKTGAATNKALKELKTQPALNVGVLKKLTAYFKSHSGGFQIKTGQACKTALTYVRRDYGSFLLVSEVKSLGIDEAVAEAKTRLADSRNKEWTGEGRRFFPQKIGSERVCIHGLKIRDRFTCQHEVKGVLNVKLKWIGHGVWDDRPTGCIQNAAHEVFYNAHESGAWTPDYGLICERPKADTVLCQCNAGKRTYRCEGHPQLSGKCKMEFYCRKEGSWFFPGVALRAAKICME